MGTEARIVQIYMLGGWWRPWTWIFGQVKLQLRRTLLTGPPLLLWPAKDDIGVHRIPVDCEVEVAARKQ